MSILPLIQLLQRISSKIYPCCSQKHITRTDEGTFRTLNTERLRKVTKSNCEYPSFHDIPAPCSSKKILRLLLSRPGKDICGRNGVEIHATKCPLAIALPSLACLLIYKCALSEGVCAASRIDCQTALRRGCTLRGWLPCKWICTGRRWLQWLELLWLLLLLRLHLCEW